MALSGDPDFEYARSTARSSGSTNMAPALKGDSKSGNRALARRSDDQIVALVDALGNLSRFTLLPSASNH